MKEALEEMTRELLRTAGFSIWPWRCRPTALPMSGWRLWRMRNTAGFHRNLLQNKVKI